MVFPTKKLFWSWAIQNDPQTDFSTLPCAFADLTASIAFLSHLWAIGLGGKGGAWAGEGGKFGRGVVLGRPGPKKLFCGEYHGTNGVCIPRS